MLMLPVVDAASNVVLYIVPFLLVLMTIVFVHELGHFLAARWCRIRVSAFSLGFGRELLAYTDRHGTRWRLALWPLGGYVSFASTSKPAAADAEKAEGSDAAPTEAAEGAAFVAGDHDLRSAPLRHRAFIVAAGPLANFVFTFVLYVGLGALVGTRELAPRIGFVEAGSPAAAAGLQAGDVVTEVGSHPVHHWSDIERLFMANGERELALRVDRAGRSIGVRMLPHMVEREMGLGMTMRVPQTGIDSDLPAVIGHVVEGLSAAKAGLLPGDRVVAIEGRPIVNFRAMMMEIKQSPGRPLVLTIERGAARLKISATPTHWSQPGADGKPHIVGRLGVIVEPPPLRTLGPVAAVSYGARETARILSDTASALASIFTSREAAQQVGGPIMMAEATAEMVKVGPSTFVMWMALLSANLGLFNLLPIPVLDGGHLVFYALEAIRRKPLGARAEALSLRLGLAILGTLVVLANLSDLLRVGRRLLG